MGLPENVQSGVPILFHLVMWLKTCGTLCTTNLQTGKHYQALVSFKHQVPVHLQRVIVEPKRAEYREVTYVLSDFKIWVDYAY